MNELLIDLGVLVVVFILGVLFSHKIKDSVRGVPKGVRAAVNTIEAHLTSQVKTASAATIAKVTASVAPAPVAPKPVVPAPVVVPTPTPAAPAPAA